MDDKEFSLQEYDREKIKTAVRLHTPIEITSYTLPKNMEVYIYEVLSEFLEECHQEHMTEYLKFCVGELLNNAKKANTKRVYFIEKNLNINDDLDYNEGMVFFKDETLLNIDHYLEEQKKAGLYIKLVLQVSDDFITIEIKNNCLLTKFESQRIQEKLNIAQQYDNIDDVFTKVLDQTEGAGLGIIIIILMLQKIGLSKQNYKVITTDNETITKIVLPLNEVIQNDIETISETFVETQDTIPILEESFEELKKKLNNPLVTSEDLLESFCSDVMMAFLLLSEACKIHKNTVNIHEAISILGVEKIKEIFTEDNPKIRLISSDKVPALLFNHGTDVAFFAYNLAKNFLSEDEVSPETIYTAALIHDIECIVLKAATEEQRKILQDKCKQNNIQDLSLELFYGEICHSKNGGAFAEKWGLNPLIIETIKYHNDPDRAADNTKKLIACIYLADIIQYYLANKVEYYQINKNVLQMFGIDSETKLNYIIKQIKSVM